MPFSSARARIVSNDAPTSARRSNVVQLEYFVPALESAEIENVVDQPKKAFGGGFQHPDQLVLPGRQVRFLEHLSDRDDGTERAADLVAHHCDETRLFFRRLFRTAPFAQQLLLVLSPRRRVEYSDADELRLALRIARESAAFINTGSRLRSAQMSSRAISRTLPCISRRGA